MARGIAGSDRRAVIRRRRLLILGALLLGAGPSPGAGAGRPT